jgi:hypothetical protein
MAAIFTRPQGSFVLITAALGGVVYLAPRAHTADMRLLRDSCVGLAIAIGLFDLLLGSANFNNPPESTAFDACKAP